MKFQAYFSSLVLLLALTAQAADDCKSEYTPEELKYFKEHLDESGELSTMDELTRPDGMMMAKGYSWRNDDKPLKRHAIINGILHLGKTIGAATKPVEKIYNNKNYHEVLKKDPHALDVLQLMSCRRKPVEANQIWSINMGEEFSSGNSSYCHGFSSNNRNLLMLTFFDQPSTTTSQPKTDAEKKKWLKETLEKVKKVLDGEPQHFSGVANLNELTKIPEVRKLLGDNAAKRWKNEALNLAPYKLATKAESKEEFNKILDEAQERLKRGEMPKVYFSSSINFTHTTLIYDIQECKNGEKRVYVWDPDIFAKDQSVIPRFIRVTKDGNFYPAWSNSSDYSNPDGSDMDMGNPLDYQLDKAPPKESLAWLNTVRFTADDEEKTVDMANGLTAYCKKNPLDCLKACDPSATLTKEEQSCLTNPSTAPMDVSGVKATVDQIQEKTK